MHTKNQFWRRLHNKLGWFSSLCLMLPIIAWVWLIASEPVISVFGGAVPKFILSGKIFNERFNIIHAGFVLDQPTIGKWLFGFTIMLITSLPYTALVGWMSNRGTKSGYFMFGITITIIGIFLLCIISWPLCWLVQYICSMGFTLRRIFGLIYAAVGIFLVVWFMWCSWRKPKKV